MAKKNWKLGVASALAAGAGAAYYMKKTKEPSLPEKKKAVASDSSYRNTELGKYKKNSKGIYYSNGNYEAFARPEKPEGIDE